MKSEIIPVDDHLALEVFYGRAHPTYVRFDGERIAYLDPKGGSLGDAPEQRRWIAIKPGYEVRETGGGVQILLDPAVIGGELNVVFTRLSEAAAAYGRCRDCGTILDREAKAADRDICFDCYSRHQD
jgi:hypothetical protein